MNNLRYEGQDAFWPQIPRFAKNPSTWFLPLQIFVTTIICIYSFLIGLASTHKVIFGFRRSYADEQKAEEFFLRYDVEFHEIEKDVLYYQALDIIADLFRPKQKIHPVHFTDLRWYPWRLSTNAERPFSHDIQLKRTVQLAKEWNLIDNARMSFHNLFNAVFIYCRNYIHKIKNGSPVPLHEIDLHVKPALVSSDEVDKVRTVFGVPKTLIFAEAMFHWPLFSRYFTDSSTPLLWNYETLNGGWYKLNYEFNSQYKNFKTVFNLDWSEYDMRVYFSMWKDCRDKVKEYFCFCGNYCPTRTYPQSRTDPHRLQNLWNWIETAYFDSISVTTTGKRFKRLFAGMPSGIFCTQFWDSFYNGVMVVTILLELGYPINQNWFLKLMGDDVLFALLEPIPISEWPDFLEKFALIAKRRFNSKLSPKKCGASPGINGATVLSYTNWNGYPTRPVENLLAQLLHPKSLRDSPPRLMARAIGIYYASAGSPQIRPICEMIYTELKNQGYTPHRSGLSGMFDRNVYNVKDLQSESWNFFPLDHFPSLLEVTSRLCSPSTRNPELQSRYWDRTHFLEEAGSCTSCELP